MRLHGYAPPLVAEAGPETSTLAMVAVYPTLEQAEAMAVEGGLEAADLHCTLVFLGEAEEVEVAQVHAAVRQAALLSTELTGNVGGAGSFAEGPDGVPVIALPDVKGLTKLREDVVAQLAERGVESPSEHGFLPHMTLTYSDADPIDVVELGQALTFGAVSVVIGGERTDYELTGALLEPELTAAGMYAIATPAELTEATQQVLEGLDELVGPLATSYEDVLRAAGRRMGKQLRSLAEPLTAAAFVPPNEDEVSDGERLAEDMAAGAAEAQREAVRQVGAALNASGISFDIDAVFTDELLEQIGNRTTFAADQELRSIYRDVIAEAAQEGWSIPDTAGAIIDKVDAVAAYRAEAMARTDLVGLVNGGSVHVATQTVAKDQPVYKTWLATDDERTRESHVEADGQSVPIDDNFRVGDYALMPYPGYPWAPLEEVINCRCTVIYGSEPGTAVVTDPNAPAASQPEPELTLEQQEPGATLRDMGVRPSAHWIDVSDAQFQAGDAVASAFEARDVPYDQFKRELEERLTAELAEGQVDVRIRTSSGIAQQVANDGRFKSQFESGESGGAFAPDFRAEVEENFFSYGRDLPPEQRPIYGYVGGVSDESGPVNQYGEVSWVLRSEVRNRTTWTGEDSLGGTMAPSPLNRPSALSVSPWQNVDYPLREWDNFYFEAQIHGGVSLADVERVEVFHYSLADRGRAEFAAQRLAATLRANGYDIPVEVKMFAADVNDALNEDLEPLGGSAGENGLGLAHDGGRVEVTAGLVPVTASDDAEHGHLGPEHAGRPSEHPALGGAEAVPATIGDQQELVVTALSEHTHNPDDTSEGGGSQPSEVLPLPAANEEATMSTTISERRAAARQAVRADAEIALTPVGWDAVLAVEGEITEDGRLLEHGAIAWRDLPLTLMGMLETGAWGHEGAKVAGRIDNIARVASELASSGELTSEFGVNELAPLIADRTVRGVSIDLAVLDYEYRDRSTGAVLSEDDLWEYWLEGRENEVVFTVLDGTIVGATVCPMPAIANAEISLAASAGLSTEGRSLLAAALEGKRQLLSDIPIIKVFTPFDHVRQGFVASAPAVELADPPRAAFELSEFPGNTPFTVAEPDESGWRRVFGHLATWDTCHVGIPGVCTTAPRSSTDPAYALFHQHQYPVAEGGYVDVGVMMLGTGHASLAASRQEATRHYDKPDMIGAYVRAYDGEHGIWVSGVARENLTPAGLRELRTNPPSGDWRQYNGYLELIAACAVAVPGFPVVASAEANITAAGGHIGIEALIASAGEIIPSAEVKDAMIAAGCACDDTPAYDEGIDDLADLGG